MALSLSSIERNRFIEPAAALTCAVFAILVLWLLVRLVWALVPRGDAALELAPPRLANTAGGAVPAQSVANWHLFGASRATSAAGAAAPATTLSLILRGTFAAADARTGIAVIADQSGEERAYSVGQEVTPGARLTAVYPDHIVLTHEGVEESLALPRDRNLTPGDIVRPTPATTNSRV
ncbi:MAG: type II secretion system protein N, partial [Dokdonella sp.]